jgi:integrase/recombinase XerD
MELVITQHQDIISTTSRIEELVDKFIASQDVKLSSKLLYRRTLKQYFNWVNKKGYLLSEIARPQLLEYKEELLSSLKSSLTVGSYITSVRRFYEWTEANKYYPNVAKGIRTPKRKQQFRKQPLTEQQQAKLLTHFATQGSRDFSLINLILNTGLRTIEVIRASVEDITFKGSQRVLMVQGKGRDEKDNFVVIEDEVYYPLAKYLATRGKISPSEPLFASTSNNSKGERLTTRTISYIAKEGLKAIGLDDKSFTAHSLRHTAAVNILDAGGSLYQAQLSLRHSNPATTLIYLATREERERLKNSGEKLVSNMLNKIFDYEAYNKSLAFK